MMRAVGRRKVATTVYIEADQDERLKALSLRTRVPVAEFIRQGVDLILDRHAALLPGQLSFFEAPAERGAERVTQLPKAAAYRRTGNETDGADDDDGV